MDCNREILDQHFAYPLIKIFDNGSIFYLAQIILEVTDHHPVFGIAKQCSVRG